MNTVIFISLPSPSCPLSLLPLLFVLDVYHFIPSSLFHPPVSRSSCLSLGTHVIETLVV
jgi:hypothetical protein